MEKLIQNRKIRWGIIGLGNIAHKFATDLLTLDDSILYAVASRTQESANNFASKFNAIKAYGSYEALANDPNVDAIYIATPHSFHKEHTLLCLDKGIAVLCEKPFAMNLPEVEIMIAKAKERKVLLMEALWTYFLPHYRYALDLLNSKELGNIMKLEADFGFKAEFDKDSRIYKKTLGGGSLLDIGIYPIFTALSILGKPNKIEAQATFFDNGADSTCSINFKYNENVNAYLKSTLLKSTPTEAIIYCDRGTIKINSRFHAPSNVTIIKNGKEKTVNFENHSLGYSFEIKHFNELLKDGKTESDIMTYDFSKKLMQLLDEIRNLIGLEY